MKSRAVPAIALRRSNNAGGHYFMSLYSGKRIHGYKWKELPIDDYVINRVEELAEAEDQPVMHNGLPNFEWSPGEPIEDIEENVQEGILTIANGTEQIEKHEQIGDEHVNNIDDMNDAIPLIKEENNNQLMIEDEHEDNNANNDLIVDNGEGLDIVVEDNIVSDEDDIVDPSEEEDEESSSNDQHDDDHNNVEDIAVIANIDDESEPTNEYLNNRPRRKGAGAGVERLQMNHDGKEYTAQREFNLVNNGILNGKDGE